MDRDYIKLCAEMSYNDVIMESVLSEEVYSLQEGELVNKIKALFDRFITFLRTLWSKISSFFLKKKKEIKDKLEELKKKREEKKQQKAVNDSASLYDNLMEMVLHEEDKKELVVKYVDLTQYSCTQPSSNINRIIDNMSYIKETILKEIDIAQDIVINEDKINEKQLEVDPNYFMEKLSPIFDSSKIDIDNVKIEDIKIGGGQSVRYINKLIADECNFEVSNLSDIDTLNKADKQIAETNKQIEYFDKKFPTIEKEFKDAIDKCEKEKYKVKSDNAKLVSFIKEALLSMQTMYSMHIKILGHFYSEYTTILILNSFASIGIYHLKNDKQQ